MADQNILKKAEEYAKTHYQGIKRKSGEDFINHPLRVKENLEEIGVKNEEVLASALLHGIPESTNITVETLKKEFGLEVAKMVQNLHEISKIYIPTPDKSENIYKIQQLIIQLSKDIRVLVIRLADRVDNIETAHGLNQEDQIWLAKKALNIHAPIAKALGIYVYTKRMEDLALKILKPERYAKIEFFQHQKLQQIEKTLESAKQQISKFLDQANIKNYEITFRKKGIYSTHMKAMSKAKSGKIKHEDDFEGLYDLLGLRVLVENKEDCFLLLSFLQETWPIIQEEFDDYITNPKPNGYQSLQTAVKLTDEHNCEIQIRTYKMHENNEYGASSHFAYKYGTSKKTNPLWIKELINMKESLQESIIGTDTQIKIFDNTIFTFTPKGDLINLPAGSTALDFAYAVHTDLGNSCSGAIVNDKMVKLDTKLKSGDTIKVLVQKHKKPNADWLDFAYSTETQRQIRRALKHENTKTLAA